jgi:AraC-like DNA-binding protein
MGEAANRKSAHPDSGEPRPQKSEKLRRSYDDIVVTTIGMAALCDEMRAQGYDRESLLVPVGLTAESLDDPRSQIAYRNRVLFFENIHRLTRDPCIGLRAGQRHRLQDFGIYAFALSAFPTVGQAMRFGLRNHRLAGSMLERNLRLDRDIAVIECHDAFGLHRVLPLVADFAFSTMHRVLSLVLGRSCRSLRLKLPYPAPPYAALYSDIFRCEVMFDTDVLEWHFDIDLLNEPCPNASLLTERLCVDMCDRMLKSLGTDEPAIVRAVRMECFKSGSAGNFPTVNELAARLHLSPRTLTRRFAEAGLNCQDLIDDVRSRLARELLGNTGSSIDEVGVRLGFYDVSNFSKAFKRWTSETPAEYRKRVSWRDQMAGRIDRK